MQTPMSLKDQMQRNIGTSISSIQNDGYWHSGNCSNGDPFGKISYVTVSTDKGLLVRYKHHKQGEWHVWKSWDETDGASFSAPHHVLKQSRDVESSDNTLQKMHAAWDEGVQVDDRHPYLMKKKIYPCEIRAVKNYQLLKAKTSESPAQFLQAGTILVPAYSNDHGGIIGYETITKSGCKIMRGKKSGTHLGIGTAEPDTAHSRIYVAEGYATAVSVFMRKKVPCFAVFSTSNLLSAGLWLRAKYPTADIIFAADNDVNVQFKVAGRVMENPGVYYAKRAAERIGGSVWVPKLINGKKTDWNDRHVLTVQQNSFYSC